MTASADRPAADGKREGGRRGKRKSLGRTEMMTQSAINYTTLRYYCPAWSIESIRSPVPVIVRLLSVLGPFNVVRSCIVRRWQGSFRCLIPLCERAASSSRRRKLAYRLTYAYVVRASYLHVVRLNNSELAKLQEHTRGRRWPVITDAHRVRGKNRDAVHASRVQTRYDSSNAANRRRKCGMSRY